MPVAALRTHTQGIEALFTWMTENWETLNHKLAAGLSMLSTMLFICTSSFTREADLERVQKFFTDRSTKGFDQGLAQSLDAIRAKSAWLARDKDDVKEWVESYSGKAVKTEL